MTPITKEWLEKNGFFYFETDNRYHWGLYDTSSNVSLRYDFRDKFLYLNKWDNVTNGAMSYFNKCISVEKMKDVFKAFDVEIGNGTE